MFEAQYVSRDRWARIARHDDGGDAVQGWRSDGEPALTWRWGEYQLSPAQRRLRCGEAPVAVEDRTLDLLLLLLRNRDRALDRQEIIGAIWGKRPVSDATLRQLVYKARRAVGDDGESQSVIRTLYGRSLQWVAPVQHMPAADASPAEGATDAQAAGGIEPVGSARKSDAALTVSSRTRHAWLLSAVLLCALVGVFAWMRWHTRLWTTRAPTPKAGAVTTLAVLPFDDSDPRQAQRYISDGLTEELINRLARMPQLRVTARTSSFAFRDKPVDVREVGRRLGVEHVLEGSVQRSNDKLRVRVALVDASNGYDLWTGEYDTPVGDVLGMEDQITRNVMATLYPKLAVPSSLPGTEPGVQPAAHDAYLVGLEYLNRRTRADLDQAIVYFQHAVSDDPSYADAWSALASAYAVSSDYDSDSPPDRRYDDALAAARHAELLNANLAHVHAVLGFLYAEHWQWKQAASEYARALVLDPSDANAHQWYGMYLWFMDDDNGALAQMQTAAKLDPLSPVINVDLGRALQYAGHPDEALTQYREAVALAPRFPLAHILLSEGYMQNNRYPDALREMRTAVALAGSPVPSSYLSMLGIALSLNGDDAGARAQLATLESRSRHHYVSGVSLASLSTQLGRNDKVFPSLFAAEAAHDPLMLPAIADRTAPWYSDPRITQVRARMGLSSH